MCKFYYCIIFLLKFLLCSSKPEDSTSSSRTASILAFNNPKKYVVKATSSQPRGSLNTIPKAKGQQRISDLKGVVSIDRFEDIVRQLKDQNTSEDTKIRLLKSLRDKKPSTEIIQVCVFDDLT